MNGDDAAFGIADFATGLRLERRNFCVNGTGQEDDPICLVWLPHSHSWTVFGL